ncbi:dynactin subunit 2-like [Daphnia pulicaria]|uniref:dynactin subunit 2-like n=1 Tax=Daphnia pulicaria TaxID=35523 RepID=UPI001EEC6292|nr:dynactin subunit 2-like [Daphnia pulicaria]
MADPKYAALPGIAYDQPDYYESEDVSESFSNLNNQDQSDCVEKLNTNVTESFAKFQGHWLSSQKADFSGKIGVKHNAGYTSWNGPYELQAEGEKESPIEKLNRLKCEVVELQQEVQQSVTGSEESGDPSNLAMQVAFLQKQLMEIKIDEVGFPKPELSTKRKIFEDLETVGKTAGDDQGKLSTTDPSKIVYQLQFKPQQIKLDLASKEANMLQRLEKLESLFGVPDKMNQLCAETGQKCVSDAVRSICSKVALLEPAHLDQVEGRLAVLMSKLNGIAKEHGPIEDSNVSRMVKELYEVVKQLEPLISLLPSVVDRLSSLKVLHDGAVNFSQTVGQVESMQSNLDLAIQNQLQLLMDIQEGLSTNVQAMKASIQKLDDKLSRK